MKTLISGIVLLLVFALIGTASDCEKPDGSLMEVCHEN